MFQQGQGDSCFNRDKETQAHIRAPSTSLGNSMWMRRDVLQSSRGEGDEPRSASEGRHCWKIAEAASRALIWPHQGYTVEQLDDSYCSWFNWVRRFWHPSQPWFLRFHDSSSIFIIYVCVWGKQAGQFVENQLKMETWEELEKQYGCIILCIEKYVQAYIKNSYLSVQILPLSFSPQLQN